VGLWAARFAEGMVKNDPDRYVATMSKAQRGGKIFIDHFRNRRGATAIASYSTRARPHAPVSVPLAWSELEQVELEPGERERADAPLMFTIFTVPERLKRLPRDPWAGLADLRQRLPLAGT